MLYCYSFVKGWAYGNHVNPECILSRAGCVMAYVDCPIHCCRKHKIKVLLSTPELKYITLLLTTRDVLPFMNVISKIKVLLPILSCDPEFFCQVWKDNKNYIKFTKSSKLMQGTKYTTPECH